MNRQGWEEALERYVARRENPDPALVARTRRAMHARRERLLVFTLSLSIFFSVLLSAGVALAIWGSGLWFPVNLFLHGAWITLSQGLMAVVWVYRSKVGRFGAEVNRLVQGR